MDNERNRLKFKKCVSCNNAMLVSDKYKTCETCRIRNARLRPTNPYDRHKIKGRETK